MAENGINDNKKFRISNVGGFLDIKEIIKKGESKIKSLKKYIPSSKNFLKLLWLLQMELVEKF